MSELLPSVAKYDCHLSREPISGRCVVLANLSLRVIRQNSHLMGFDVQCEVSLTASEARRGRAARRAASSQVQSAGWGAFWVQPLPSGGGPDGDRGHDGC